jgi:predicted TPR repeat methyltransferase
VALCSCLCREVGELVVSDAGEAAQAGAQAQAEAAIHEALACARRGAGVPAGAAGDLQHMLARMLHRRKDLAGCARACEAALREGESEMVRYLLVATRVALGERVESAPARAPGQYVAELFDGYAPKFNEHLVNALQYRTPQLIVAMLVKAGCAAAPFSRVADLGCGTGLGAAALVHAGLASRGHCVGVDLSAGMVAEARRLDGLYAELAVDDVERWLARQPEGAFDCVLSSDVFVYLGDLEPVVRLSRRALRPNGVLVFSVECPLALRSGYELQASRRFAHSQQYVSSLCQQHFALRQLAACHGVELRQQAGRPVIGSIYVYAND